MLKVVVNVDLTKRLIVKVDAQRISPEINLENILNATSYETEILIKDIKSKNRKSGIPDARKLYCLLARKYTKCGLREIGKLINYKHPDVLFAARKGCEYIKNEIGFRKLYNSIKERLNLK